MESQSSPHKSEDSGTLPSVTYEEKEVARVLLNNPVPVSQLQELAWQRGGLQCNLLRLRAWSTLLGIDRHKASHVDYELKSSEIVFFLESKSIHQQIELDVARSMSQWTMWSVEKRAEKKKKVGVIVHALFARHSSWACYFQGFHDIVAAILIVTGDHRFTYAVVERLSHYYFRDCMRDSFELTSHLLKLIPCLLEHFDQKLAQYLESFDMPPYFALPWVITWFSHSIADLNIVARLFDVFMGNHPLLPLYVSTSLLIHTRKSILSLNENEEEDDFQFGSLHTFITNLPSNITLSQWEMILAESRHMIKKLPPVGLLSRSPLGLQAKILCLDPTSLKFPPPWYLDSALPDWVQLRNLRKKFGKKRKAKRASQALQRIAGANVRVSGSKKRPFFWPTILSLKEAVPSLLTFSAASVCAIAIVLGIILARKIDVHIPFINDA